MALGSCTVGEGVSADRASLAAIGELMLDFFANLFDTSDFPARWHCGNWTTGHGVLHIVSDLIVFGCYVAIPILLTWFKRGRTDIPFPRVFTLFSVFILSCGAVHLVEATIFYFPAYRLSGLLKGITAVASLATVAYLGPLIPKLFAMRSPVALETEIEQRRRAEENLKDLQRDLERQVDERSRDLLLERQRLRDALGKLQQSEELLSAAIDAAPNAMALVDAEGVIRLHNREFLELFGYTGAEVNTMKVEDFLPSAHRERHREQRASYLQSPLKRPMGADATLRGLHKTGRSIPLEIGLNPVHVHGDSFTLVAIVDISERVRARQEIEAREESLRRTNAELSEFVYAASHDLQEPLRKVAAFCQLLELEVGDRLGPNAKQYIDFAVNGTHRMQQLIRDLLEYSEVSEGPQDVSQVAVGRLLDEVLEEQSAAVQEANATVRVGTMLELHTQPQLLRQVFQNLISNAIKYRHKERALEVDIGAKEGLDAVEFVVSDNGIGVPKEQRERVFRMFQRLHRKEEIAGTGLGLAVVKKAVERCGGRVWLETSPSGGLSVHFTVPKRGPAHSE